jgi:hypothetical protein
MAGLLDCLNAWNSVGGRGLDRRLTSRQAHLLQRLHRVVELKASPHLDADQRRLVNHTLYSTYWDCVNLGAQDEATAILKLPRQVSMTTGAARPEQQGGRDVFQDTGPA